MPHITSFEQMAMEEGESRGLKNGIALGLRLKFGSAAADLIEDLRPVTDVEVLRRVFESIEAAADVEQVHRASAS